MKPVFLDENLSPYVAEALSLLSKGYFQKLEVHSTVHKFRAGLPDEELIPEIGNLKGVLITRDFNIKRSQLQYDLCKEYGLGLFFLDLPKNSNRHWDMVKLLVNHWEDIAKTVEKKGLPFAYRIKSKGKWMPLK